MPRNAIEEGKVPSGGSVIKCYWVEWGSNIPGRPMYAYEAEDGDGNRLRWSKENKWIEKLTPAQWEYLQNAYRVRIHEFHVKRTEIDVTIRVRQKSKNRIKVEKEKVEKIHQTADERNSNE